MLICVVWSVENQSRCITCGVPGSMKETFDRIHVSLMRGFKWSLNTIGMNVYHGSLQSVQEIVSHKLRLLWGQKHFIGLTTYRTKYCECLWTCSGLVQSNGADGTHNEMRSKTEAPIDIQDTFHHIMQLLIISAVEIVLNIITKLGNYSKLADTTKRPFRENTITIMFLQKI